MRRHARTAGRGDLGAGALLVGTLLLALSCGERSGDLGASRSDADPTVATLLQEHAGLDLGAYRGKLTYQRHCAVCHGESGQGDGFNAYNMQIPPRNLKTDVARLDDAQITGVIREGSTFTGKSPLCPPYGRFLSDRDVADLIAYTRTLAESR